MSDNTETKPTTAQKGCALWLGLGLGLFALIAATNGLWLAVSVFVIGIIILLARRIPDLQPRFRPARRTALIGGAVSLLIGMIVLGATFEETPEAAAARIASERASAAADATRQKGEAREAARSAEAARTRGRDEFLAQYDAMLAAATPCDRASAEAGQAMGAIDGRGDVINAFVRAKAARESCDTAWQQISALEPTDGIPDEGASKMKDAIEVCGNAYLIRRRALDGVMKILDGETQPSQVVAVQEDMKLAENGPLVCVAQWFAAAAKVGVTPSEMKRS